jgi:hypothetical protein
MGIDKNVIVRKSFISDKTLKVIIFKFFKIIKKWNYMN